MAEDSTGAPVEVDGLNFFVCGGSGLDHLAMVEFHGEENNDYDHVKDKWDKPCHWPKLPNTARNLSTWQKLTLIKRSTEMNLCGE